MCQSLFLVKMSETKLSKNKVGTKFVVILVSDVRGANIKLEIINKLKYYNYGKNYWY